MIGTLLLACYGKKETFQDLNSSMSCSGSSGGLSKFKHDLKLIVTSKNTMILMTVVGGGLGLLSAIAILIEQMLCPIGYDNKLAGIASSALTFSGIIGALVMGVIGDKTKQLSSIIKFAFLFVTSGYIGLLCIWGKNLGNYIVIVFCVFGFFAIGIFPLGVELAIECTHP